MLFEILLFYNLSFVSKMHDFLIQNLYLKNLFSGYKIDMLYSLSFKIIFYVEVYLRIKKGITVN